jgi:hypothetical protein
MKKKLNQFAKQFEGKILNRKMSHTIFGGENSDDKKKTIFIYHPDGTPKIN